MSQVEQLPKNIDSLLDKIYKLKSKTFFAPPVPKIDIEKYLLTKRQIAKKMLLVSAGVISSTGQAVQNVASSTDTTVRNVNMLGANVSNEGLNDKMNSYEAQFALNSANMIGQLMTPETAHFIVYGKFKRDINGELIDNEILDPDCVFSKLAMPDTHPTFSEISIKIKQVTKVLKMLSIKQADLLDDIAQTSISIPASITAIASAAVILPPGAGIPVAFSAFQGMISNIMNLVSKISGIATDLEFLNYIPLLIEAKKIDAIIGLVNSQIKAINVILDTVDGITKIIPSVPTPPGVGDKPGEKVKIEANATPDKIKRNTQTDVVLSANASKGSWEYDYIWKGPNGLYESGDKITILGGPQVTTQYEVTAIDKKDKSNSASTLVFVQVIP